MAEPIDFTPAPSRKHRSGWTPERQRDFVLALADGHLPGVAAAKVGLGRQSAYRLRMKAGAEGFSAAWDEAESAGRRLRGAGRGRASAWDLANGLLMPRFHRGHFVGFVLRQDDAALIRLLTGAERERRQR